MTSEKAVESISCPACKSDFDSETLRKNLNTCPSCSHHFRMEPWDRIAYLADPDSFIEFCKNMKSLNPIAMDGYEEKLTEATRKSNLSDAVITGTCTIDKQPVVLALMSFSFMGGSMGSVVGKKITRAIMTGVDKRCRSSLPPPAGRACKRAFSPSCRWPKPRAPQPNWTARVAPLSRVVRSTTGGVTASFAMLGDIAIAEPGALIGFAGPRVIEGTIKQTLPEGFQRAEFQLEKGFVDTIVPRKDQRAFFVRLLKMHRGKPAGANAPGSTGQDREDQA